MKKVLLTSAIACALFTKAFAVDPPAHNFNNQYQFGIVDYISLDPSGGPYPADAHQHTFNDNNTFDMDQTYNMPVTPFKVTASRSWHVTYDATDFERSTPYSGTGNVTNSIPVDEVFSVLTTGSGSVTGTGGYVAATNDPAVIVTGKGGVNNQFTLTTAMNLSTAMTEMNIEGSYTTTVHIIAALD